MKKEEKEVKAKGQVVGKVQVDVYENTAEAIKALGEEKILSLINRQNAADKTNEFRAAVTREASPMTKLAKAAKSNPELQAKIAALINQFAGK
jgi:hypothetical protein